jgi:CubicO group peptidase (beta-lactamase class C family)
MRTTSVICFACRTLVVVAFAARPLAAAEPPCFVPVVSNDGWEIAAPDAAGFDAKALCAALTEVDSGDANIHAVIVERRGRLVAELYRTGHDVPIDVNYGLGTPFASDVRFGPDVLHDVRSVTKSVVGLLIGIARQKGLVPDLRTSVLSLFPELADLRTRERDAISIRDLLTMSSGLAWDEWNRGPITSDETRLFWKGDQVRFLFDRPMAAPPGTRFNYNGGGTATLAELLTRAAGKPLDPLLRAELFEPLGITHWAWAPDLRDRPLAFAGLRMRPRDMSKLGRLVLGHGRWRGQQIVPEAWVTESLRSQIATGLEIPPASPGTLGYGYQWWTGSTSWRGRAFGWSMAMGNGGQRVFVVPDLDLNIVTTAGAYGDHGIARPLGDLFAKVLAAVVE